MSTVIKFKRSSEFESIKKISNQLLSEKEVRRIFKFKDHDILAFKVLDNEVNEYLDFEFEDLDELDKTKNIYMSVQKLSNKTLIGEELSEISATSFSTCTSSISQESPLLNVTTFSNENLANKILVKEETQKSCAMDENFQIEVFDHVMEDINKDDEQIQDKQILNSSNNSSESYKFPQEEISHYPKLYSALKSKNLMMVTEDTGTLLRILHDSIKTQSFNHGLSYENVIDSLFSHYPHLAESYGNCITSKNIWIVKLKKMFANDSHSSQETKSLDDCIFLPPSKIRKLNAPTKSTKSKLQPEYQYTRLDIPLSRFERNSKLNCAFNSKKYFNKGQRSLMLNIIMEELIETGQNNRRGFECAGAFVFNNFWSYFQNARKDKPKEFIKYYKQSLGRKQGYERRRNKNFGITKFDNINSIECKNDPKTVERYGFPHYAPYQKRNIDDFNKAIEVMKHNELLDSDKLSNLMNYTFVIRRQLVISKSLLIEDFISTFPALFSVKQFAEEINRITGVKVLTKELLTKLKDFACEILPSELSRITVSKFKPALNELRKATCKCHKSDWQKYRLMLAEIAVVVKEDPSLILGKEVSSIVMSPYMVLNNEKCNATLMVNGTAVIQNISAIDMPLIWCSSFPILHLEVPKKIQKTYRFLSMALLKWKHSGKGLPMPFIVLSLFNSFDRVFAD